MIRLIIYRKSDGRIESIWNDYENNSITSMYPDKPEMLELYEQIVIDVPLEVEKEKSNYKVEDLEVKPIGKDIEKVRQTAIESMSAMCESKIVSEFYSNCLGEMLHFGCKKDEDQPWIIGLYMAANNIKQLYPELADIPNPKLSWKNQDSMMCFDFTPNQMIKLGDDMQAHIKQKKDRFYILRIWAMDSSRTISELEQVNWNMEII